MRDLNYDFKQLCRRNRDGSFATQADRQNILDLCADQLYEMGMRDLPEDRDGRRRAAEYASLLRSRLPARLLRGLRNRSHRR